MIRSSRIVGDFGYSISNVTTGEGQTRIKKDHTRRLPIDPESSALDYMAIIVDKWQ